MELGDGAIWQVAAGDTGRSYHDLCLRWGVILFGPGYRGPWPECKPGLTEDRWTKRKIGLIRKFCETISPGDLIVLRLGTAEVYGCPMRPGGTNLLDSRALCRCSQAPYPYGAYPRPPLRRRLRTARASPLLTENRPAHGCEPSAEVGAEAAAPLRSPKVSVF